MPGDIIGGTIGFVQSQLNIFAWDGEVPRQDPNQAIINLDKGPVFRVVMEEGGLTRDYTMGDTYTDDGPLTVQVWATTRAATQSLVGQLEGLLIYSPNWDLINIGPKPAFWVYNFKLERWTVVQEEVFRSQDGAYIYRGDLHWTVGYNGSVLSRLP